MVLAAHERRRSTGNVHLRKMSGEIQRSNYVLGRAWNGEGGPEGWRSAHAHRRHTVLPQSRQWFTTFTPSCVHSCCSTGTSNMLPWAASLAHCIPMVCACRSSMPNSSRKSLVSCHARARSCCPRGCPIAERIAHGGMVEAIGPEAIWNEYRREADTSGSDCHGRPNPAGGGRGEVSKLIARSGLTRNLASSLAERGASDGCSLGTLHRARQRRHRAAAIDRSNELTTLFSRRRPSPPPRQPLPSLAPRAQGAS